MDDNPLSNFTVSYYNPVFIEKRVREGKPRAGPCSYLQPTPKYPSGTIRVLEDSGTTVTTRDTYVGHGTEGVQYKRMEEGILVTHFAIKSLKK